MKITTRKDWINKMEASMGVWVVDYLQEECNPNSPTRWKRIGDMQNANSVKVAEILKSRIVHMAGGNDTLIWNAAKSGSYKERNRKIFREEEMDVDILLYKIQVAIEEIINGKIFISKFKYYSKWDMEMEQAWKLKQSSSHTQGVRDEEGNLVGAVCGQVGFVSNNIAKIIALEEGLKWIATNDIKKVVIEGDSKVILSKIINHQFTNLRLNAWIPRIYGHLQKFMDYQFQHTYREGNKVADLLANHMIAGTLPVVISPANVGNRDIQQRLLEDRAHIPRARIVVYDISILVLKSCERKIQEVVKDRRILEDQGLYIAKRRYVYEIILCLLVDVPPSKEAWMEKLEGFVREEDVEAMGGAVPEVEEEWANILGPYFNPATNLSDAECSDPEDEICLVVEALRMRNFEFMAEACEVFQVGVRNEDSGPFRRMMMKEDGWLSKGSIDKVVTLGMRATTILRLM
ncbi:hypothetical protein SUGI_1168230 [Cryptomeria japonica]|nr:hypothetical protein SUGI_1168230 [Cryptomeria japonica]